MRAVEKVMKPIQVFLMDVSSVIAKESLGREDKTYKTRENKVGERREVEENGQMERGK